MEITKDDVREALAHRVLLSRSKIYKILKEYAMTHLRPAELCLKDANDIEFEHRPEGVMIKFMMPENRTESWPIPQVEPW